MQAHSSESRRKKVAVYIRMSTDQQQDSPERQRSQIQPFCERKGYDITSEYVDLGIGGARSDRLNFQRLLADAKRRQFDLIVVDEMSRLSRQEPISYVAEVLYPLQQAEVMVDSIAEGMQDPGNLAGMILTVVRQDKSSGERKTLSRRIMTGLLQKARQGDYVPSKPSYGYRAEGHGKERRMVLGPPEEIRTVQWIFDMVANQGWSIHMVTKELTMRGVAPPNNCNGRKCPAWNFGTVRKILRNRRYLGDCVWGETKKSSLHEMRDGEVKPASIKGVKANPVADVVVIPNTHQAIIDRDTFQRAQDAMARRRKDTCPKQGEEKYLLRRLMVCGDCGAFMNGNSKNGKRHYWCSTYVHRGNTACFHNKVLEEDILPILLREIQAQYLNPESLARLRENLLKDLEESRQSGESERIQKRIDELGRKIQTTYKNMAQLEDRPHQVRQLSDLVDGMEKEVATLRASLAELSKGEHTIEEEIAMAEEWLWRLRDALTSANPSGIRAVLEEIVDRVELFFAHVKKQTYTRSMLTGGTIVLKHDGQSSYLVTPGK